MNDNILSGIKQYVILLIVLTFSVYAQASEYVIKFEEGAYQFNPSKKFDSLDNKYLSKVTVTKDQVLLIEVRGSTLPDAVTFYQFWHNYQRVDSPSDNDVLNLYEDAQNNQSNIQPLKEAALIPDDFLAFMYEYVTYTPVLYSGLYKFTIGLHKNGNSVRGKPYVPRLMGNSSDDPFSG